MARTTPRLPAPSFAGIDELGEITDQMTTALVLTVCGLTDVGVVRTNNEDAFAVMDLTGDEMIDVSTPQEGVEIGPRGVLLALSDGMGGANAGEVASTMTLETIGKHLTAPLGPDIDVAEVLERAVQGANSRVARAADAPGRDGMGATLVAVLIDGTSAYLAEVGDSRAYVLRRGSLTQISKDQTQIQVLLDQGLFTPEMAKNSRAKNIVLQAIGKTPELIVAQRRLELRHGDRLLLCSDGLTAHVTDDEIGQILSSVQSLAEVCTQFVTMTNERGGKDNVTVLVAEITWPSSPRDEESVDRTLTTTRAFSVGEGAP